MGNEEKKSKVKPKSDTPRRRCSRPKALEKKLRVKWPEVVKVLSDANQEKVLRSIGKGLKKRGYGIEDFKYIRIVRVMVSNTLTKVEDTIEGNTKAKSKRAEIRKVRRRLELELWP